MLAAVRHADSLKLGGYGGDAFYSGLLHAGGMGDFVMRDLERYRPMLAGNGANWESFTDGEVNHAWTGYPGYLFQKYISGIQPTGGGFSTFDVRPEIGGLAFAESTVPTVKGSITTRWEKTGADRLLLTLTVPPNSRATVYVPKPEGATGVVEESGRVLWTVRRAKCDIPGLLSVEENGSFIKCQIGAGRYRFTSGTSGAVP